MASPTIERPSVQVIQEFQEVSPTILTPTMPACIMGPCVQVIEAVQDDGSLNPEARISLPARIAFLFVSSPFQYAAIGGDTLEVSVNNAAVEQIVFSAGPNLTVDQVADDINEAAIPGLTAVVETSGTQKRVVIYTEVTGENASLEIGAATHNDVITAFGITRGFRNVGASGYNNYWALRMGLPDYPDPRDIIDEVVIDYETVRAFINDGSGTVREVLKTESFLDGATSAVTVQDDGDGDNLSPYLNFAGAVFHDKPAQLVGTVDWTTLTFPADFGTHTLEIIINGVTVVVTFASPGSAAAAAAAINSALGVNGTCVLNGSNQPVITSALAGVTSSVLIGDKGTIDETVIGLAIASYAAGKPAKARAQGIGNISNLNYATGVHSRVLRFSVNGEQFQQLVMPATINEAQDIVDAINALWGTGVASMVNVVAAAAQVWQIDDPAGAPVFVDETTDFNDIGAGDVDPWPAVEAIGDQFAIGFANPWDRLLVNIGTAGVGGTLTWKYWNGAAWVALPAIVDASTGFTLTGMREVTWDMPTDWVAHVLNGSPSLYYVVAEVLTVYGTNPVLSQGHIGGKRLVLNGTDSFGGKESEVRLDKTASDATLLTSLGLTGAGAPYDGTATVVFGGAFSPLVGDEVWVNGVKVGQITEVPATPDNRLRLSVEQLLTYTGSTWFIRAKGLDNQAATATRPSSDLRVDATSGAVRVKHALFRDSAGVPTQAGPLATYLAYNALRKDVSPAGTDFNLLRFGTTTDLEAALAPLDTQNPLGLGMYFALLNAPGVEVAGLGVDETSTTEPEGSLDSYTRAFEYLESKDVYAIAPLTHANAVGQVGQVHVDELSKPENGLERIVILNPLRPTRKADTLVASAATANVAGPPTNVVNTGIADLQAKLAALGKPGPTYVEADGVFLKFEDDENLYLIESVSGPSATVNDGPLSASNTLFFDGGGSPVFTSAIVDRPVSVFILGGSLGSRTDEADAYAAISRGYLDRRVIATVPDQAKASIDGLETAIAGYYLNAGLAGKMSAISPSQPLTNETLAGFSGVIGSQDRYSEMQLKILSGGGLWVFFQEADGQPVKTRHQLTTDMSSIEKRESSITRALDFTAKFLRAGLKNFIGRFNITTNVQDAISIVIDGLAAFLIRQGVLKSFEVNAIRQSASAPDTLEIDATVGVPYPLNYIRLTMVI